MKRDDNQKILYKCLIDKINCKKEYDNTISRKKVLFLLGNQYHVPKDIRNKVISELIKMDILEFTKKGKSLYYKVLI